MLDQRWPYAALDPDGTVRLAETATELVAQAIDGYEAMSDDDALTARYDSLVELGDRLQEHLRSEAAKTGMWDPGAADENTLTALYQPRGDPIGPLPGEWECPVPLVAVTTDYQPFTDRPAPTGRVVWLDPSNELVYLRTLHEIGAIELYVHVAGEVAA